VKQAQRLEPTLFSQNWAITLADRTAEALEMEKEAEAGRAAARFQLGMMYLKGNGVLQDDMKARSWFQKAIAQGNADAIEGLKEANDRIKARMQRPRRNEVYWFAQKPDGKSFLLLEHGRGEPAVLDPNALGSLKVGNGTSTPAIGKLIDTFTDRKVCSFIILPKTALTIEHVPDGTYQLIFVFGEVLAQT
jgi:TPR repeat protein